MVFNQVTHVLQKRTVVILAFVLVLSFITYQIISFYQFIHHKLVTNSTAVTVKPKFKESKSVLAVSLFGEYLPNSDSIKASSLDLKVVGISFSGKSESSQVIIQSANGEERVYFAGDKLPGGAEIRKINKNHVVISYNGELQRLNLLNSSLKFEKPLQPLIKD